MLGPAPRIKITGDWADIVLMLELNVYYQRKELERKYMVWFPRLTWFIPQKAVLTKACEMTNLRCWQLVCFQGWIRNGLSIHPAAPVRQLFPSWWLVRLKHEEAPRLVVMGWFIIPLELRGMQVARHGRNWNQINHFAYLTAKIQDELTGLNWVVNLSLPSSLYSSQKKERNFFCNMRSRYPSTTASLCQEMTSGLAVVSSLTFVHFDHMLYQWVLNKLRCWLTNSGPYIL